MQTLLMMLAALVAATAALGLYGLVLPVLVLSRGFGPRRGIGAWFRTFEAADFVLLAVLPVTLVLIGARILVLAVQGVPPSIAALVSLLEELERVGLAEEAAYVSAKLPTAPEEDGA